MNVIVTNMPLVATNALNINGSGSFVRSADGVVRSLEAGLEIKVGELVRLQSGDLIVVQINGIQRSLMGPVQLMLTDTGLTPVEQVLSSDQSNALFQHGVEVDELEIHAVFDFDPETLIEEAPTAAVVEDVPEGGGSAFVRVNRVDESLSSIEFNYYLDVRQGLRVDDRIQAYRADTGNVKPFVKSGISLSALVDNDQATVDIRGATKNVADAELVDITITDHKGETVTISTTVTADGSYSVEGVDVGVLSDGELTIDAVAVDYNDNEVTTQESVILATVDPDITYMTLAGEADITVFEPLLKDDLATLTAYIPVIIETPEGNKLSLTGFNADTGQVDYECALLAAVDHPEHASGSRNTLDKEGIELQVTDNAGSMASAEINVAIIDDIPEVHDIKGSSDTSYVPLSEVSLDGWAAGWLNFSARKGQYIEEDLDGDAYDDQISWGTFAEDNPDIVTITNASMQVPINVSDREFVCEIVSFRPVGESGSAPVIQFISFENAQMALIDKEHHSTVKKAQETISDGGKEKYVLIGGDVNNVLEWSLAGLGKAENLAPNKHMEFKHGQDVIHFKDVVDDDDDKCLESLLSLSKKAAEVQVLSVGKQTYEEITQTMILKLANWDAERGVVEQLIESTHVD